MRLIDANEAYESARSSGLHDDFGRCMADLTSLKELFEDCTTVDAVEVVHGRWEFSHTTTVEKFAVVKCSNCGHEAFAIAKYVKEGHYCPQCGAKMDGDWNG